MRSYLKSFVTALALPLSLAAQEPARPAYKIQQTFVNGLLVMTSESGAASGLMMKMVGTSVDGYGNVSIMNPDVGQDMQTSLQEIWKYMQVRHKELPSNRNVEISFEERYTEKDGPSAAVACAMLVESLMTGKTWDPLFAVTGDMNVDGSVQPVGGVDAKFRAAAGAGCKLLAVPVKAERVFADLMISDGPMIFLSTGLFGIRHFDEAVAIASTERSPDMAAAVSEWKIIQEVCQRDLKAAGSILRTPQAQQRLQAILDKAPNMLSAKYLLLWAQGRAPKTYSLRHSIDTLDKYADQFVEATKNDEARGGGLSLKGDELMLVIRDLRRMRTVIDPRTMDYLDSLLAFAEFIRTYVQNPARSNAGVLDFQRKAVTYGTELRAAKDKLIKDPQVVEIYNQG